MADETPPKFKPLSPEEKAKIQTWITSHWAKQNCPMCTHIDWRISNYLVATMTIAEGKIQLVGQGPGMYGFALVFCGYCGFSTLLHANVLGLSPSHGNKTSDK